MDSFIPGLPDDVGKLCIARLPLSLQPSIHAVCRSWRHWLTHEPEEVENLRRDAGLKGDQLFLLTCKSMFSERRDSQETAAEYARLPWLWNGRCFAKFSYRLAKTGFDSAGKVKLEHAGEEFACKLPFPYAKAYEAMICVGRHIYLFQIGRNVWRCDTATGLWQQVATRKSYEKRFAWGVIGGQLYVAGGQSHTAGGTSISAEVYDLGKDKWSHLPQMPQVRGRSQGYVTEDGKFLVLGTDSRGNIEPAALIYDPEGLASGWSILESFWPYGGRLVGSAVAGKQMYVVSEHGRAEFELRQFNGKAWRSLDCEGHEDILSACDALLALDGGLLIAGWLGGCRWLRAPRAGSVMRSGLAKLPHTNGWTQRGEEVIVAAVQTISHK